MDSLFLLQFACFIFMLINAFIVALSHLHVRWENKRYELYVVALFISHTHQGHSPTHLSFCTPHDS